jgi:hypothetical protein
LDAAAHMSAQLAALARPDPTVSEDPRQRSLADALTALDQVAPLTERTVRCVDHVINVLRDMGRQTAEIPGMLERAFPPVGNEPHPLVAAALERADSPVRMLHLLREEKEAALTRGPAALLQVAVIDAALQRLEPMEKLLKIEREAAMEVYNAVGALSGTLHTYRRTYFAPNDGKEVGDMLHDWPKITRLPVEALFIIGRGASIDKAVRDCFGSRIPEGATEIPWDRVATDALSYVIPKLVPRGTDLAQRFDGMAEALPEHGGGTLTPEKLRDYYTRARESATSHNPATAINLTYATEPLQQLAEGLIRRHFDRAEALVRSEEHNWGMRAPTVSAWQAHKHVADLVPPEVLAKAIENIVTNFADHMIEIYSKSVPDSRMRHFQVTFYTQPNSTTPSDPYVVIRTTDSGDGIPARVFTPPKEVQTSPLGIPAPHRAILYRPTGYETTRQGGTGEGSHSIAAVTGIGGEVFIETNSGGTKFYLYLPISLFKTATNK